MQTLEEAQDSSRLSSTISPVLQNKNTHPKNNDANSPLPQTQNFTHT
jgi:hypothetical protein